METIAARLRELLEIEGIEAEDRALTYIARQADGALRDGLSLLEQCISFYFGQKLTYEKNILYNHTLPCLLPCEFRIEDGEEYYYYETGIYTKLKDRISMLEPKLFFAYLLEVFEQVASYLLELDHLKLDLESMFLDKENRPVLCYLPEYEKRV